MTLSEYFSTPESVLPQELVYGALRVAESPTTTHQQAVGALFIALHEHVRPFGSVWLAPLDVVLDAERALVVQPDLFVVLQGGAAVVLEKVHGAPDLVIEVLSPKPRIGEVAERLAGFRDHGVRECWLVHQIERRIEIIQFEPGRERSRRIFAADDVIVSGVLPEFSTTLTEVIGY